MDQEIKIGSIVRTPTGRPGVVVDVSFGARGDLPRVAVRYLDVMREIDGVLLQPELLRLWEDDAAEKTKAD